MHKCEHCGTEFEGKFCPECGFPAPPETCPKCGTPVRNGAKFCTECGYSFKSSAPSKSQAAEIPVETPAPVQEPAPIREEPAPVQVPAEVQAPVPVQEEPKTKPEKAQKREGPRVPYPFLVSLLGLLPYFFSVLFALFSAVVLLSYLGSLTGGALPLFGSIYNTVGQIGKIEVEGLASIPGVCIALIVIAGVSFLYACILLAFRFDVRLRIKKAQKGNLRVVTWMECAAYVLYFVHFLFGCILCAKTKTLITEPGAAPICLLVFSLVFSLLSVGAHLCMIFGKRWFPAEWKEIEERKQRAREEMGEPVAPKELPQKPAKPAIRAVVEETDELQGKVNRYIRSKRLALCFVGFFLPFFVIGSLIGFCCCAKKPKGWRPDKVCKRSALVVFTVINALIMLAALGFSIWFWSECIPRLISGYSDEFAELGAPLATVAFLITLAAFIFALVVLVRGKKLTVTLFGTAKPKKDAAIMAKYYEEAGLYPEKKETYRTIKREWRKYRRMAACYDDGVPYGRSSLPLSARRPQWVPSDAWINEPPSGEEEKQLSPALTKALSLLPYAVAVFFAVFSALLFLIFLGQAVANPFGGMGSIYALSAPSVPSDSLSGAISEAMGAGTISGCCAALLAFAVIGVLLALCLLLFRLYIPLRVLRLKGKRVAFYLECAAFGCYFVDFLLACILCGTAESPMSPGAGSICVLVFVLLFGLCSAAAVFFYRFLPKLFPETADALKRRMAERRAALIKPESPEKERLEKPVKPQYDLSTEPDDALRMKVKQYEKSKLSFIAYACVEVVVFAAISLLFSFLLHLSDYRLSKAMEEIWGKDFYINVVCCIITPIAGLLLILGNVFTAVFVKNYNKKRILPKKAWNPDSVWKTAVVWILAIALPILLFAINEIAIVSFTRGATIAPENRYFPGYYDPGKLPASYYTLGNMANLIMTAAYLLIFGIYAIVLLVRSKKLSKELYGASHPKSVPELKAKHEKVWSLYLEQRSAYEEQETAWRNYRRALAYFEEGLPFPGGVKSGTAE